MSKIRPLWLWLSIVALIALLSLLTQMQTRKVHSQDFSSSARETKQFALFVPSPYELTLLTSDRDIWPRKFGPKQPPEASDLPVIYSLFMRKSKLRRDEVDFFRSLAMTTALEEWDSFRDVLSFRINLPVEKISPDRLLQWVKSEKCSPYGQEIAFRLAQWDSKKLFAVKQVFAACDAESFHALWFELLEALPRDNQEELSQIKDKFQSRRQMLETESFEYFILTQAFESIDMKLIHQKGT